MLTAAISTGENEFAEEIIRWFPFLLMKKEVWKIAPDFRPTFQMKMLDWFGEAGGIVDSHLRLRKWVRTAPPPFVPFFHQKVMTNRRRL